MESNSFFVSLFVHPPLSLASHQTRRSRKSGIISLFFVALALPSINAWHIVGAPRIVIDGKDTLYMYLIL